MSTLSRESWRALPLEFVVRPTLDAPMLAFPDEHEVSALMLQEQIASFYEKRRKSPDPKRRRILAFRIGIAHRQRVALAIGVRVPGRRIVFEFTDA